MMKILDLTEEFHQFVSVAKDRIALGMKHDKIAYFLKQLELCESILFLEILDYIEQQETRKRKLEQELQEPDTREVDAKNRVDKVLKE